MHLWKQFRKAGNKQGNRINAHFMLAFFLSDAWVERWTAVDKVPLPMLVAMHERTVDRVPRCSPPIALVLSGACMFRRLRGLIGRLFFLLALIPLLSLPLSFQSDENPAMR
jgi:hypothetical protein